MPDQETAALLLIKQIRKNVDTLEHAIATANHSIVQARAALRQLEHGRGEVQVARRKAHYLAP